MKNELASSVVLQSLSEIIRLPRPQPSVRLVELLATFDEVDDRSCAADAFRPKLLRWALLGQTHEAVAWCLCRATEDSMKALRLIFRAATKPEPLAWSGISAQCRELHRFKYGWLQQSLFGGAGDAANFITVEESVFIAGVAATEPDAFWKFADHFYTEKERGGHYAQHVYRRLTFIRTSYARTLAARGVKVVKVGG